MLFTEKIITVKDCLFEYQCDFDRIFYLKNNPYAWHIDADIIFKKIPKDSGHLVLYNPSVDFTYRYEKIMKPYFFQHIKLEQKDNILFIFPSYMKHMVTACTNKIKRITYSGNFDIIL